MKRQRFSKELLRTYIQRQLDHIQEVWKFNPRSGTVQLKNRSEEAIIAYGKREALLRLVDEFDLSELY